MGAKLVVGVNDLASLFPEVAAEWHPTKNGSITAQQITKSSNKKVWWQCWMGHEWEAVVGNRTGLGNGCPFCGGRKLLSGFNDLATINSSLASEWHPTKNGSLTAHQITAVNPKKVWWLGKCGHEWESVLSSRAQGTGCPACAGQKVIAGFNDLATTDPDLAAQWHPTKNGALTANQISRGTNRKVWWSGSCGHEWQAGVKRRTGRGDGCSVCTGHTFITGINDLVTLYPDIAAQWHPSKNGDLDPTLIGRSYEEKVWWLCSLGHEWEVSPHTRTNGKIWKSDGCFVCKNVSKVEEEVKQFLLSLGLKVESSNRTILGGKEIDLWIPEKKVGIEVNGLYWHREEVKGKDSHYEKWSLSNKARIQLVQLWEDDWKLQPELIKKVLVQKLGLSLKKRNSAQELTVGSVTSERAATFLKESHLQGFAYGASYLALIDARDRETLQALLVLDIESDVNGKVLNIVRFATQDSVIDGFAKLLSHAIKTHQPESITAVDDHCMSDANLYEGNRFEKDFELPPDYVYLFRNERMSEDSLNEMGITDLTKLARIWDAGKTRYRLIVGK